MCCLGSGYGSGAIPTPSGTSRLTATLSPGEAYITTHRWREYYNLDVLRSLPSAGLAAFDGNTEPVPTVINW